MRQQAESCRYLALFCTAVLSIAAPALADVDDDPNERIAFRLTDTVGDGLTGVVVGRLFRADPAATYEISARILQDQSVIAEISTQQVSAARSNITVKQPSGARFAVQLDLNSQTLRATYTLKNLAFGRHYSGEVTIRELAAAGAIQRLSGIASASLADTAPEQPPPDTCAAVSGFTSICQIQRTTTADGSSPIVGQVVTTRGRISGPLDRAFNIPPVYPFFVQDGAGRWSGILVIPRSVSFDTGVPVPEQRVDATMIGYEVEMTGTIQEIGGATALVDAVAVLATAKPRGPVLSTILATANADDEAYEGVLVSLQGRVATAMGPDRVVLLDDPTTNAATMFGLRLLFFVPAVGQLLNLTGIVHQEGTQRRFLVLRSPSDIG
jgi:hypothetical protein